MAHQPKTLAEAERALDAGSLMMMRPWGDYVYCRRRRKRPKGDPRVQIYMEAFVEASFSTHDERLGFPTLKIVPLKPTN